MPPCAADRWPSALLRALRSLATETDPSAVAVIVRELLLDHLGDRARCLFHDPDSGSTWCGEDESQDLPPERGLVARAAASGEALLLERAADDPEYVAAIDDPGGDPRARLLVQPVAEPGGPVHAVLTVARDRRAAPFDAVDAERIETLARHLAARISLLSLQLELDAAAAVDEPEPIRDTGPYRAEAIAAHAARREQGEVVRLDSGWISWCYRTLVVLVLGAVAYVCLVQVGDYATGPALVRLEGRTEVTAIEPGSVAEVLVGPGEEVAIGQPLVRLHDTEDAAQLRRLELELELELRNLLRDPADEAARRAVTSLRAEQQQATLRGQVHVLRSPAAGVVVDLRTHVGQAVRSGDVLLSLREGEAAPQLVALLPGDERPRLREGQALRLELDGYPDARILLHVEAIDGDVVAPAEARRLLGSSAGDDLALDGPVVLLRARLPDGGFVSRDLPLRFHDGMRGRAEVEVRSTSIIEALIPALERR